MAPTVVETESVKSRRWRRVVLMALFLVAYKLISTSKKQRFNLPPSPPYALPILGHHLLIKPPVHRLFHRLSETYGPIFSLRVGYRRTVVISSSSLASECFTGQNDILLSNRPCFLTAKYVAYNYTTVGTAPYGDHWRNLRRVCSLEILSSNRLTNFLHIRKDEIRRMLTRLTREVNKEIELEPLLSDLTFNNIVRMVTGKRYYGDEVHNEEEANLFKKLVADVNDCSGARHPGDYLPFFKIFGGTFEKKVKAVGEAMDEILQRLLDECRADKDGNTMVNHLLSLQEQEPDYYTDVTIKGLMLGMMIAGTDTSAVTLEWAMACLLRHPESLEKARLEIEDKIGQERLIDEPDLANLPYLQNIVSETFRLYPAAPLLVPRSTTEDIKVGGYDVPRGTMVMVNAWAIHRDPILWNEPEKFKPERFNDEDVHKLMSFGNGRRACPGAGLGQRIVTLALGSLIQCFDWKKVNGEKIDMTETSGMAMRKKEPLRALSLLVIAYKFIFGYKTQRYNLPPSPPNSLPIIGHHRLIKPPVHRLFHGLAKTHGPIFYLRLGTRRAVVISSFALARECFTGHNDVVVSNRPRFLTSKYIAYNYTTIATTPYGDHWRNLRKICSLEIVSSKRLANFLHIRKEEIHRMLTRLSRDALISKEVELESLFYDLTFNNIVRMVTGKVYYGEDASDKAEADTFKKLIAYITSTSGARHPGEYLPFLKIFGRSFEKKVKAVGEAMDAILQRLLDECRGNKDGNTMVNHLLSLQQQDPEYYSEVIIKGLMLGIMFAASETSAVTIEWAMASLLNHPDLLENLKLEIDEKIGQDRLIEETDIPNLPYLQNVVSETLRLYPAAPLLVPRLTVEDIKIGGYDVPRETMVMVNAWSIHRDPELWTEPERFNPERFNGGGEGEKDDVRMLITFGSGRRMCPGAGLANKIVTLALGSLIQCFEWGRVNSEKIDMTEGPEMAMRKVVPLRAMCQLRPVMNKLLTESKV
ncbi:hypothetical protein Bca52824_012343 [Brassica carinata]|uniref:Cytochrome P450 n=1 Tax=Brassica carinata TaxID=52824 RepID=A0A8X7VY01_BRACI|nr:hypothetical protein Bca52824_012343 [Brassica carinata]